MGNGPDDRTLSDIAMRDVGWAVSSLSAAMQGYRQLAVVLVGFSVRAPKGRGDEFLMVIRGEDEAGAPVVAFHSAMSLGETFSGAEARLSNGTLRWREDEFATR